MTGRVSKQCLDFPGLFVSGVTFDFVMVSMLYYDNAFLYDNDKVSMTWPRCMMGPVTE